MEATGGEPSTTTAPAKMGQSRPRSLKEKFIQFGVLEVQVSKDTGRQSIKSKNLELEAFLLQPIILTLGKQNIKLP